MPSARLFDLPMGLPLLPLGLLSFAFVVGHVTAPSAYRGSLVPLRVTLSAPQPDTTPLWVRFLSPAAVDPSRQMIHFIETIPTAGRPESPVQVLQVTHPQKGGWRAGMQAVGGTARAQAYAGLEANSWEGEEHPLARARGRRAGSLLGLQLQAGSEARYAQIFAETRMWALGAGQTPPGIESVACVAGQTPLSPAGRGPFFASAHMRMRRVPGPNGARVGSWKPALGSERHTGPYNLGEGVRGHEDVFYQVTSLVTFEGHLTAKMTPAFCASTFGSLAHMTAPQDGAPLPPITVAYGLSFRYQLLGPQDGASGASVGYQVAHRPGSPKRSQVMHVIALNVH